MTRNVQYSRWSNPRRSRRYSTIANLIKTLQLRTYRVGERVVFYMPSEVTGKNRKLARPYHGLYPFVAVTPPMQKWSWSSEPVSHLHPIFVAINRLRKCYRELSDTCWTGRKQWWKHRPKHQTVITPTEPVQRKMGTVIQSMTRKNGNRVVQNIVCIGLLSFVIIDSLKVFFSFIMLRKSLEGKCLCAQRGICKVKVLPLCTYISVLAKAR